MTPLISVFCVYFYVAELIVNIKEIIVKDAINAGFHNDYIPLRNGGSGALAYAEAIIVYLTFILDKMADYNSSICSWSNTGEMISHTFGMTGISMSWDYAEVNPFSNSSGCYDNMVNWVTRYLKNSKIIGKGHAIQKSAQSHSDYKNIMISTDPPYYNNVPYADFSDFFYCWMKQPLKDIYPELFSTILTPKSEELVADPYRLGGKESAAQFFEDGMYEACSNMNGIIRDDIPLTLYYAYKQTDTDGLFTEWTGDCLCPVQQDAYQRD